MNGWLTLGIVILAPLAQLVLAIGVLQRRRLYLKRSKTLRSFYCSLTVSMIPWVTYSVFLAIVLNLWLRLGASGDLVVLWAKLGLLSWVSLPLLVICALLPPYPPRTWSSTLYRCCAIGTAFGAWYLTHRVFPMGW